MKIYFLGYEKGGTLHYTQFLIQISLLFIGLCLLASKFFPYTKWNVQLNQTEVKNKWQNKQNSIRK